MKRILTMAVMVLAASSLALNQNKDTKTSGQSGSEEQAVMQLERELAKAYVQGDAKTLERILADELTDTSAEGLVFTKQYHLKYLKPLAGATVDFPSMNARVYGNAAVVTGVAVFKFNIGEGEDAAYYRFTDTFVKRQSGWQLIATQQQRLPERLARYTEVGELKLLAAQDCSQESSLKSLNYDVPTFIRFTNATSHPIVINWIDYEGKRDPSEAQRQTLGAGQSGFRYTFLTHPFLATDASGKCLGIYQPTREPSLAVIK